MEREQRALETGHGAAVVQAADGTVPFGFFFFFRQINFQPSISNPMAQIEEYHFAADFADTSLQLLLS